jgi:spore germination protein GerM
MTSSGPGAPPPRGRRAVGGAARNALTALAVLVVLSGCTVGGNDSFHEIKDARVPTLPPTTTTSTTTVPTTSATTTIPTATTTATTPAPTTTVALSDETLYFISGTKLKAVVRRVPATLSLQSVLTDLGTDPPPGDNLRTAVRSSFWSAVSANPNGSASVELTPEFAGLSDSEAQLAIAQIVYTLTFQPGVGQVAFVRDGKPLSVPRKDGSQTDKPVSKVDYPEFVAQ